MPAWAPERPKAMSGRGWVDCPKCHRRVVRRRAGHFGAISTFEALVSIARHPSRSGSLGAALADETRFELAPGATVRLGILREPGDSYVPVFFCPRGHWWPPRGHRWRPTIPKGVE